MIFPASFPNNKTASLMLLGAAGPIEAATTFPLCKEPRAIVIVCHPDPRQQGTMNNKVVTTVVRAAIQQECASLRFNFRGVGNSAGVYGNILGESLDLRGIIKWVRGTLPGVPICLAGFSFGSYISALVAVEESPVQLISIAPPVNHYNFADLHIDCPWLVIQGDEDEVVPYKQVITWHGHMQPQPQLILMPGVTHFFHGHLPQLQQHISETLLLLP